ncbi:patatin-like phospholipase domain-containing protein 4 isoform X2 [Cricetulus griseus]|uniref:Patatin-like phospholipase domain-containing protein 4 isoform X2 n=1 Tax=Cricetulus griseus TaxID=10029 RepID=A0A9J7K3G9_CRIGR|nr:patatin-like phospholipase domain-containing protein 4 isoform X2 [Cricetulus griseus]
MTWPVGVSFAACGFLGVYHLGAAMALRAHGAGLLRDVTAFAGASAGALVAAALLTAPGSLEACTRFAHALAEDTRRQALGPATPGFDFMERLRSGVDRILPANAHELARDRLHVSITNARTRENRLVSCFASRDDLIQVLLASSFIPVYMGLKPVEYAGQTWVDGGLTDSLPVLPAGRTVTVSPFCGRHDVSPRDPGWRGAYARVCNQDVAVSPANLARLTRALFPPTRVTLESLFRDGFRDTVGFLRREGRFR